jgi:hypothetical protein
MLFLEVGERSAAMGLARWFGGLRRAGVRAFVLLGGLMVRSALELFEPFAVRVDGILRMRVVHAVGVPGTTMTARRAAGRSSEREHGYAVCKGGTAYGDPFIQHT